MTNDSKFYHHSAAEDVEEETIRQQMVVKRSLTQAFKELKEAERDGIELPNARDLFK